MILGSEKNFSLAAVAEISAVMLDDPRVAGVAREVGDSGIASFLRLLCWAAKWRRDGSLHDIDDDLVERIAGYSVTFSGEPVSGNTPGAFSGALRKYGFLENDENGVPRLCGLDGIASLYPCPRRKRGGK
jgi:hypothetical protein